MLSYQHSYHAGCFADVIKHLCLSNILQYMVQKDKALFYLDTHAGRGMYDLHSQHANKTQESKTGIEPLWQMRHQLPDAFSAYIQAISKCNEDNQLRYYPGSPALAMDALRPQDRLFFCERHPGEFDHLDLFVGKNARVHCVNEDGYLNLNALLPPKERRGLIMIDPSYELKTEYRTVTQAIKSAYQHFATGVYCLWYPLIDNKNHNQLLRGMYDIGAEKQLRAEFYMHSKTQHNMHGTGLWIVNPPFSLESQLNVIFDTLSQTFPPKTTSYLIE